MDANLNNSTASFQCKKCETWLLVKLNNDVISKAICVNRWNSFGKDWKEAEANAWNARVYPAEVQAAIERDTPKKLIFPTVKKKSEEKEDMPRCPACEKLLGKVAGRTRHTYPCKGGARTIECNLYEWDVQTFCPECGQRLDWSEE